MLNSKNIAVIPNQEGLDTQALLSDAMAAWRKTGIKVVGVLAENNRGESVCSAGFVRDIVSERAFSIQLDTPPADTSCHLDATGLEHAAANLLGQVSAADIVVLSKFGKLEAMHGGLWPVFQAAMAAGKPLLTTVSAKHHEAWNAFAPTASWLTADQTAIMQWWRLIQE